ncbi:hypothetical protein K9M48_05575 [Candidatus Gracilibacteria bacterium]|nr:hypothetical protein [Candidatus Gracilibacteria bacterium]
MNYELFKHDKDGLKKNIFLVNMTKELDHNFSQLMLKGLSKYIKEKKKIGIIMNKKGYSNGIICKDCGYIPQCKKCSVSINYYKMPSGEMAGICHICKSQYNFPSKCGKCGSSKIKDFGIGTQKLAEIIKNEYGITSTIIESETANSPNKIKKILAQISNSKFPINQSQVIIGTSLLCQPIKNYTFDLIIFLNADLGLSTPDYNSAEKNFYFIYEALTKHNCQNFIIQTFNPDHHSIRQACKLDKDGFYEIENQFRKDNDYPPFKEICIILYKNEIEERLFNKVDKLYKELLYLKEKYEIKDIEIYSTPPLIYKIFGKYRYNIIIKGSEVKNFMDIVYTKLKLNQNGFKINRQAKSIV